MQRSKTTLMISVKFDTSEFLHHCISINNVQIPNTETSF